MLDALFSTKGRIRRRDWWLWSIAVTVVVLLSQALMHRFLGQASFTEDETFKGLPSNGFQYWILFLATFGQWPTICLMAKRWHDRNRPGWLAALGPAVYLPQVALVHFGGLASGFAPQFATGVAQAVWSFVVLAYSLWVLIDCGILDGTQGQNKYGPSPKGVGAQPEDIF